MQRCLAVGAGGGSVARWLAERVGPTGEVVATDFNTKHLPPGAWGLGLFYLVVVGTEQLLPCEIAS